MDHILSIGNTHALIGDYDGSVIRKCDTPDLFAADAIAEFGPNDTIFAGCVVPALREALEARYGDRIRFIRHDDVSNPDLSNVAAETMGADRLANAVALLEGPLPAICIDFGTAIHSVAVDENKRVVGGFILPGRQLMRNALAHGTAQLPTIDEAPETACVLGRTTPAAMAAGIDHGARGAVAALACQARRQLGARTRIVLAGGDAPWFQTAIPDAEVVGGAFTLRGLALVAQQHKHAQSPLN